MNVTLIENAAAFEALRDEWNGLAAGVPFRRLEWLGCWWRNFGPCPANARTGRQLATLAVRDPDGSLIAVAPWYLSQSLSAGSVLRFLGSGVVCSDYLSIPCRPGREADAVNALAEWLGDSASRWDLIELGGVDAQDAIVPALGRHLAAAGHRLHESAGPNCWRLALPDTWEQYLSELCKPKRQLVRRLTRRMFDSGRAVLRTVENAGQWNAAFATFRDLHQRRRQSLGQPGCFSTAEFAAFLDQAGRELFNAGRLDLLMLEIDGRPAAAEYNLLGDDGIVYYYQAGIDPARLGDSPGHLLTSARIRRAIDKGFSAVDFLRGDERYKGEWNARSRASIELRIVGRHAGAELRHTAWLLHHHARNVAKRGWTIAGRLRRPARPARPATPKAGSPQPQGPAVGVS